MLGTHQEKRMRNSNKAILTPLQGISLAPCNSQAQREMIDETIKHLPVVVIPVEALVNAGLCMLIQSALIGNQMSSMLALHLGNAANSSCWILH
jgi:hypothetical protein